MTTWMLALVILAQVSYTDSACTMPDLFRSTTWLDNVMGNITFTTASPSGPCKWTNSACTMPDLFRSTTWLDNVMGNISFTTWKMSGWPVQTGVDEWEIVDNVKFAEDGYLALRSLETFVDNGTTYYSYMCFRFERITYAIYKYYLLHDPEPLANNNRVLLATHDDLTMFEEICDVNYNLDEKLFGVFIRDGQQPSMTCPNPILTSFKYEVTVPPNTVVCTPEQTGWQGCANNKRQVELQNNSCSHPVAYSASGKLNCLTSVSQGGRTSVMLMNTDAEVDNINTFRFACAIAKDNGKEMVIAPKQCYPGQTEASFPMDKDGDLIGQRIQTSKIDSECRIYPVDSGDDGGLSTPAIIGIAVGALVFIVLVIGVLCCFCKMRGNRG